MHLTMTVVMAYETKACCSNNGHPTVSSIQLEYMLDFKLDNRQLLGTKQGIVGLDAPVLWQEPPFVQASRIVHGCMNSHCLQADNLWIREL